MNILITNYYLEDYAGTELYTYNLAKELKRQNQKVFVYSPFLGRVAKRIRELGIKVTNDLKFVEDVEFDIIHAHHNITAIMARSFFPKTPMVFLSHGILPRLEQPPSIDIGINKFIGVSEEVKDYLIDKYKIPLNKIEVIYNAIDTDRYKPTKKINNHPKNILVISNRWRKPQKTLLEGVCKRLGCRLTVLGLKTKPFWNTEEYINKADLVISLGRGILEGMACGRAVLVFDYQGADGLITEGNYGEVKKHNFSGRRYKLQYTEDDLVGELKRYHKSMGEKNREIILENHNLKEMVKELINIYKQEINIMPPATLKKYDLMNELLFYQKKIKQQKKQMNEIQESRGWKFATFIHKVRTKIPILRKLK